MTEKEAYIRGYLDGLEAYAWWKDGVQYVGTTGTTLETAKNRARNGEEWNMPHFPKKSKPKQVNYELSDPMGPKIKFKEGQGHD